PLHGFAVSLCPGLWLSLPLRGGGLLRRTGSPSYVSVEAADHCSTDWKSVVRRRVARGGEATDWKSVV
ncbi:MAG: hypothetical protein ACKO38_03945, partial [Planctomycetota bacterium]